MKYLFTKLEAVVSQLQQDFSTLELDVDLIAGLVKETNSIKTELKAIFFKSWTVTEFENFTAVHHLELLKMITLLHNSIEKEAGKREKATSNVRASVNGWVCWWLLFASCEDF